MHPLFFQLTVRWMSLITGAAHTTAALRAMTRDAPEPEVRDTIPDPGGDTAPRQPRSATPAVTGIRRPKLV